MVEIPKGSLIAYMSEKAKRNDGINLAQGIPGMDPPQELLEILKAITDKKIHQYPPGAGNYKLLELLKESYSKYNNFGINNFLLVQGATEAIALIYIYLSSIHHHKLSVLSFDPPYESFSNLPDIFKHRFYAFEFNREGKIDFNKLEKAIISNKINLVILSSPGNPYGRAFSKSEITTLVELSLKYNFYIIFDAVYSQLYYNDPIYIPLDILNGRIFYVNSFSKLFSTTGWRIGYMIADSTHIDKIKNIHDYIGLCAPSLLQQAIADYMEQYDFGVSYIELLRKTLSNSFKYMHDALSNIRFGIPEINGGYFIWSVLPEGFNDGFEFAINLFDSQKVAVVPGIHFSKNAKKHIRFNIFREVEELKESINRISNFINS